jgi:hypothetical protein
MLPEEAAKFVAKIKAQSPGDPSDFKAALNRSIASRKKK